VEELEGEEGGVEELEGEEGGVEELEGEEGGGEGRVGGLYLGVLGVGSYKL